MIRRLLIAAIVLAVVGAGAYYAVRWGREDYSTLNGYAEGRFRLIAPEVAGRIVEIAVRDGDHVEAGALIARLDDLRERAELARAEAAAEAAQSRFDDAAAGGREPEILAARELMAQAQAAAEDARADLDRVEPLFAQGVVPRARLDAALAAARAADARVAEMRERVTLAELPARENALMALDADARAAEAAVEVARRALAERSVYAPSPGRIERVLREAGETASPSAPIARFLPDGEMLAVVFAPEPIMATLAPGDRLEVVCDACPSELEAVVSHISSDAEFTPPIIYSDRERSRLVFRVEARFADGAPPAGTPLRARVAQASAVAAADAGGR
jgi:HlyD family secretion protein